MCFLGLLFGVAAITPGLAAEPVSSQGVQAEDTHEQSSRARLSELSAASSWNATVGGQNRFNTGQWSASTLNFRVYDGFNAIGRDRAGRQPAYGVDVNAQLEKCSDGNTYISALNIGGLLYEPSDRCGNAARRRNEIGSVSDQGSDTAKSMEPTEARAEPTFPDNAAAGKIIDCEPATWSCQTLGH
jgi:hypothetical protein